MFYLKLLGGASLCDDSGPLTGSVVQRRRLALLSLLAAAPTDGVSREKLAASLWPELDAERAHHRLADTLYALREVLGKEAVRAVGGELLLDREVVRTDLREFRSAVQGREWERAAALYRGPFLDGFFVADAPEFERWVEEERQRLAREYASVLEALAEEREGAGDQRGAVEACERLAAHDPYSSRVALRLMRARLASGDPAGALQHARVHEALLRTHLGVDPDPAVAEMAERIRRERPEARGSGTVGREGGSSPAREAPSRSPTVPPPPAAEAAAMPPTVVAGEPGSSPASPPPPEVRLGRIGPAFAVLVTGVLAVLAIGVGGSARGGGSTSGVPPIRSIAVLPLENLSGDPEQEYFADGMTDALITELARREGLRVTSRTSSMQYKDARQPLPEIARELGVDAVVEGTVLRDGNEIRITAQLIRAATDDHLWAESYARDLSEVLVLQDEIARAVAGAIHSSIAISARAAGARDVDPGAYTHYLKARHLWNQDSRGHYREAIESFERAIRIEPSYAPAYAGLSAIYVHLDDWGVSPRGESRAKAKAAALKALALNRRDVEAHTSLGHVLMHEEDWPGAEREFLRAIELNPSYTPVRTLYAFQLAAQGRSEEAVAQARRALEIDPLSRGTNMNAGHVLYFARRYDEAIEQWRRMIELYPHALDPHLTIARAYLHKGRHAEAGAWLDRAAGLSYPPGTPKDLAFASLAGTPDRRVPGPEVRLALAYAHAVAGRRDEAVQLLGQVQNDFDVNEISPWAVAQVHAALGDRDSAFHWLGEALQRDYGWLMFLDTEPAFDPLRRDPRFAEALARMRLDQR